MTGRDHLLIELTRLHRAMRQELAKADIEALEALEQQRQALLNSQHSPDTSADKIAVNETPGATRHQIDRLQTIIDDDRALQAELTGMMDQLRQHHISRMRGLGQYQE